MDHSHKEEKAIGDLSKPRLRTNKNQAKWTFKKVSAPPQMTRVRVQTVNRVNRSKSFSNRLITIRVHLTFQATSDSEEQVEVERALVRWSTTRLYSKSTLRGRCWYMEGNLTFAVGCCGTTMERSTYLKRATCEHQANRTRSIQITQTTCSHILRTMQCRRQAKTMEPSKMAIRLATLLSKSIAKRRPKTLDSRTTQFRTISFQRSRSR